MNLDINRLEELVQEELADLLEAAPGSEEDSYAAAAPEKTWQQTAAHTKNMSADQITKHGLDRFGAAEFAKKNVPGMHKSSFTKDSHQAPGSATPATTVTNQFTNRGDELSKARSAPEFRPGMGQNVVSRRYQHQDPSGKVSDLFQQYKKQTSGAGKQRWADKTQQGLEEESTMNLDRNRLEELVLEELADLLEQKPLHTELPVAYRGGKLQRKAPALKYWTQRGEARSIDDKDPEHKTKFSSLDAQGRTPSGERAVGSITMDQAKARDKEAAVPSRMATGGRRVDSVKGQTQMYSTQRSKTRGGKTDSKYGKGFSSEYSNVGNKPDTIGRISGVTPEQVKKYDIKQYDPKSRTGELHDTWLAGADRTVSHGYSQELSGDPSAKQLKKGYEKMGAEAGIGKGDLGGAKQWQDKGHKGAHQTFRYGTTPGAQRKTVKGPSLGVDTKIGTGTKLKNKGQTKARAQSALKGTFGMRGLEESTMKLTRNNLKRLVQEEIVGLLEADPLAALRASLASEEEPKGRGHYLPREEPEPEPEPEEGASKRPRLVRDRGPESEPSERELRRAMAANKERLDVPEGKLHRESTMKLSRNDLKQLVQEEVGVLLEQPGGAGVDTSGVQQSHKVTQILRIIDGMREDEINALMTAMKSAGLPIAI